MGGCSSQPQTKPDAKPHNAWPVGAFAPGGLPDKPASAQSGLRPSAAIPGYPSSTAGMKVGYPTSRDPGPGLPPPSQQHFQQSQFPSAPAFSHSQSMPIQRTAGSSNSPPSSSPYPASMGAPSTDNRYPTIPFGADHSSAPSASQYPVINHRPQAGTNIPLPSMQTSNSPGLASGYP